jgi:hypothetical protein
MAQLDPVLKDTGFTTCHHPIHRYYCWTARDDTVPGGVLMCVACAECGAVLSVGPLRKNAIRRKEEAGA